MANWQAKTGQIMQVQHLDVVHFYAKSIRLALQDFVSRSNMVTNHTVDSAMAVVINAVPTGGLLLALDNQYRLAGLACLVKVQAFAGDHTETEVALVYRRPGSEWVELSQRLNQAIDDTARAWGSQHVIFVSNRGRDKAWGRYGYVPVGTVYSKAIG